MISCLLLTEYLYTTIHNTSVTHHHLLIQKIDSYVNILSDNDVTTVEMLLVLEEADYVSMGLGLPIVRTMLRKATEIVNTTAQYKGDDDTSSKILLLTMND